MPRLKISSDQTHSNAHPCVFRTKLPRKKSSTQDRHWPDRLAGSRTRGFDETAPMVWKNLGRAFRLANGNFCLFGLANTDILVSLTWPIPTFWSVQSGQYPYLGLFGVAKSLVSVCLVCPIPTYRCIWSGRYADFDLIDLANAQ